MGDRSCYWAKWPARSARERTASGKLAEGEELGSNLLRVARSSLGGRAVPAPGSYGPTPPRPDREAAETIPQPVFSGGHPLVHPAITIRSFAKPIASPLIDRMSEPDSQS
jgi:hypothetical protein